MELVIGDFNGAKELRDYEMGLCKKGVEEKGLGGELW